MRERRSLFVREWNFRNGPNTVPESSVSNTELSESLGPHRAPGSELSEFLSAYHLCAQANSPSFSPNSPSLPQNSVSSLSLNSTLETVFRPFPSIKEDVNSQQQVRGCCSEILLKYLPGIEKALHGRSCPLSLKSPKSQKRVSGSSGLHDPSKSQACSELLM